MHGLCEIMRGVVADDQLGFSLTHVRLLDLRVELGVFRPEIAVEQALQAGLCKREVAGGSGVRVHVIDLDHIPFGPADRPFAKLNIHDLTKGDRFGAPCLRCEHHPIRFDRDLHPLGGCVCLLATLLGSKFNNSSSAVDGLRKQVILKDIGVLRVVLDKTDVGAVFGGEFDADDRCKRILESLGRSAGSEVRDRIDGDRNRLGAGPKRDAVAINFTDAVLDIRSPDSGGVKPGLEPGCEASRIVAAAFVCSSFSAALLDISSGCPPGQ